jgi:hypothetical protein
MVRAERRIFNFSCCDFAVSNLVKQHCDIVFHNERLDGWGIKALGDCVCKHLKKRVEKSTSVQQRDRLLVSFETALG